MNYDVFGTGWSKVVGPNAPLNDTCAPASDQEGSAVSAVQKWMTAGIPANQIVLALAAYGHGFFVDQSDALDATSIAASASFSTNTSAPGTYMIAAYPPTNSSTPEGDPTDTFSTGGQLDECGRVTSAGWGGVWNFGGMVDGGFLNQDGTAASGLGFRFDTCSQTVRLPQYVRLLSL